MELDSHRELSCCAALFIENLVAMVKAAFWIQTEILSNRNPRKVNLRVDKKPKPTKQKKKPKTQNQKKPNKKTTTKKTPKHSKAKKAGVGVFLFVYWLLGGFSIRIFAHNLSFKFIFSCYLYDRFFHSLSIQAQLARNHFITSVCSHFKKWKIN